jgi:hypothetical protein
MMAYFGKMVVYFWAGRKNTEEIPSSLAAVPLVSNLETRRPEVMNAS